MIKMYKINDRVYEVYKTNVKQGKSIPKYALCNKLSALIHNHTEKVEFNNDSTKSTYFFGNFRMCVDEMTGIVFWIEWGNRKKYVPKDKVKSLEQSYLELGLSKTGNSYKIESTAC